MLRSLYAGISGLRAHQTMLDVTGNNIANVNTTGYKATAVRFEDTLSQLVQGAGTISQNSRIQTGGTNPVQVGLGVQIAGISTNMTQGSTSTTGRSLDMMVSGDGYFVIQTKGEQLYTRAGSFDFDSQGRLVTSSGDLVMGYGTKNGDIDLTSSLQPITAPVGMMAPATTTSTSAMKGNLADDAATGTVVTRDIQVYDSIGNASTLSVGFTKTASGWDVSAAGNGATATSSIAFSNGALPAGTSITVGGIAVSLDQLTGYAGSTTASVASQNGAPAGKLTGYSFGSDGTLAGTFDNGKQLPLARVALVNFANPGGLQKAGDSTYRASANSGVGQLGAPGQTGYGSMTTGALEMSNVDLSQEFTNLIVAQRGFQANAKIITTSDEMLNELTQLKR